MTRILSSRVVIPRQSLCNRRYKPKWGITARSKNSRNRLSLVNRISSVGEFGRDGETTTSKRKRLGIVLYQNGDDAMANYTSAAALKTPAFAPSDITPAKTTPVAQPRKSAPVLVQRETAQALPNKHATQPVYRQGLLGRLIAKVIIARQYAAEREVARYLATTGGKMTDSVEREIQRRLF
jgi:hypothetical protein